jgi:hypothetical protein
VASADSFRYSFDSFAEGIVFLSAKENDLQSMDAPFAGEEKAFPFDLRAFSDKTVERIGWDVDS